MEHRPRVNELYKYAVDNEKMFLTQNFNAEFWNEYQNEHERFDRYFKTLYSSFKYILGVDTFAELHDTTIAEQFTRFQTDVENFLTANEKRYLELWRVNVVPDADYSITNNYDMTETMSRKTSNKVDRNADEYTDTVTDTMGSQDITDTNTVAPFDSETYNAHTQDKTTREQYIDTHMLDNGAQHTNETGNGTEDYDLTRKGNIGVMTQTEVMRQHNEFWKVFDFYKMVFNDIADYMLLVN